jgi:hypothetical protein
MKPFYRTVFVNLGGRAYSVHCRVLPPRAASHAGADSSRYLDPGSPPRVQVLRILRGQEDVTEGALSWWTKRPIVEEATRRVLQTFARLQQLRRALRRHAPRRRIGRRIA